MWVLHQYEHHCVLHSRDEIIRMQVALIREIKRRSSRHSEAQTFVVPLTESLHREAAATPPELK